MERVVLYYPTIDLPSLGWLRQSILYWDVAASVIPQSAGSPVEDCYDKQIQYLQEEKRQKLHTNKQE